MRFLVVGAGALGGYFGGRLLRGGAEVEFLVRPRRAAQLADRGLVVKTQEGEIRTPVTTVQAGRIGHSYDAILLCCKAYDLDGAMADIEPAIGAGTAIAPVLNGVKHLDLLVTRFGRQHVLGGMTAVNATMAPDGDIVEAPVKVEMTTFGEISGERSERCSAMQRAFAAGGMNVSVSETILAPMWAKFTGWASGATVATLCRCRAGAIAAVSAGAAFVNAAIDECTRVATAEGYPPPDNIAEIIRELFSQPGSQIGPSILVDMENSRPTEGEHTIGDLMDRAQRHGLAVPLLTAARCNLQVYEVLRQQR